MENTQKEIANELSYKGSLNQRIINLKEYKK